MEKKLAKGLKEEAPGDNIISRPPGQQRHHVLEHQVDLQKLTELITSCSS